MPLAYVITAFSDARNLELTLATIFRSVSQSVSQRLNDSVAGPTTATAFISTQRQGSTSGPEIFF